MFAISVRDIRALLNAAVHKFSAGVCSAQHVRVLHVFFLQKLNVIVHCLNVIVIFVILLSLLVVYTKIWREERGNSKLPKLCRSRTRLNED